MAQRSIMKDVLLRMCKKALAAHAQYLENANVSEDHDQERTVEGDGAREDEVAQVLSEQALPLWWGTCRCN